MRTRIEIGLTATLLTLAFASSARAAITATVTGDTGSPAPLTVGAPIAIRNMDVEAHTPVDAGDAASSTAEVVDQSQSGAAPVSGCHETRFTADDTRFVDYHGNLSYSLVVRLYTDADCRVPKGAPLSYVWTV